MFRLFADVKILPSDTSAAYNQPLAAWCRHDQKSPVLPWKFLQIRSRQDWGPSRTRQIVDTRQLSLSCWPSGEKQTSNMHKQAHVSPTRLISWSGLQWLWNVKDVELDEHFLPFMSLRTLGWWTHSTSAISSLACAELMLPLSSFLSHHGLVQNTDGRFLGGNEKTIAAVRCVGSCQVWLPPRMALAHYHLMNRGTRLQSGGR